MPSFNQITLLGNCTRDPEMRFSTGGLAICSLGLAVNTMSGSSENRKQDTCFIDLTCFGRTAEIAGEYLKKGDPVLVTGKLRYETWEGQDGQKRSKHSVVVDSLQLMGKAAPDEPGTPAETPRPHTAPPASGTKAPGRRQAATTPTPPVDDLDKDDIPF